MDYIAMARKMRALLESAAHSLSDEEAIEAVFAYPKWKANSEYKIGDRVRHKDILYKVLQDHVSAEYWAPDISPSLFARILGGQEGSDEEIGDWEQPDSTNPYMIGDKVRFDGHIYESLIDNNVWSPAAYPAGWRMIE